MKILVERNKYIKFINFIFTRIKFYLINRLNYSTTKIYFKIYDIESVSPCVWSTPQANIPETEDGFFEGRNIRLEFSHR